MTAADEERLRLLRSAIHSWGGTWSTRRAQHLYQAAYGPGDWRAKARADLSALNSEGTLTLHDEPSRRTYTPKGA
ncbi:hypothetical protein ACFY7C_37250 [Streptomyces sp. NPDC012769]|uniref:hypothetical protein n=1 Tax=Streptomyces sp. NPDC012769 TaxID=3364848 RepID=UPI0036B41CF4